MTVAEFKEMLSEYRDDMDLFIVVEDRIGIRRLLLAVNDFSDRRNKVFLSGRLSKYLLPRESENRLDLN